MVHSLLGFQRAHPPRAPRMAQGMPIFKTGMVDAAAASPVGTGGGGGATARHLLPDGDEWDFDMIVVDVPPGQADGGLVQQAHFNNHGALLLAGEGIYKLGDTWCVRAACMQRARHAGSFACGWTASSAAHAACSAHIDTQRLVAFSTARHRHPVRAGDAVWAAPYVPHWFVALGSEPARLIAFRDRNVDPFFIV